MNEHTISSGVSEEFLEHMCSVSIDEIGPRQIGIKVTDHCLNICIERHDKLIHFL